MVCKAWALIKPVSRFLPPTNPFKLRWNLDLSPGSMFLKKWNGGSKPSKTHLFSSWWFEPHFKILVKLAHHFPEFRGEHNKSLKPLPFLDVFFLGELQLVGHHGGNVTSPIDIPWGSQLFDAQDAIEVVIRLLPYALSIHLPTAGFETRKAKSHQPKNGLGIPIVCYSYSWLEQFLFKEYVTRTTNVK